MKRKGLMALLGVVVGLAVLAAVGIAAYNFGVNSGNNGGHAVFGPMMRGLSGGYFGIGSGWWRGILPALLFGFVIVLVVWVLLGTGRSATTQAPGPSSEGPAGLRELVEMHDRGALTDDEFTAAKRKLLGL